MIKDFSYIIVNLNIFMLVTYTTCAEYFNLYYEEVVGTYLISEFKQVKGYKVIRKECMDYISYGSNYTCQVTNIKKVIKDIPIKILVNINNPRKCKYITNNQEDLIIMTISIIVTILIIISIFTKNYPLFHKKIL